MTEPTPQLVRDFWHYMTRRFGASVVDKRSAGEMKAVGTLLGAIGVLDRDAFLARYATTIGRNVYIPFDIGTPSPGWSLWGQLMVCAHELQHVVQYDRMGPLKFAWKYIGSSAGRTALEAEAYRCQLELQFWRTGELVSPAWLASSLKAYAVSDTDIAVAEKYLAMSAESVRRGAVINETSKAAIEWLGYHAPEIRFAR
jgi:hypothetical protein